MPTCATPIPRFGGSCRQLRRGRAGPCSTSRVGIRPKLHRSRPLPSDRNESDPGPGNLWHATLDLYPPMGDDREPHEQESLARCVFAPTLARRTCLWSNGGSYSTYGRSRWLRAAGPAGDSNGRADSSGRSAGLIRPFGRVLPRSRFQMGALGVVSALGSCGSELWCPRIVLPRPSRGDASGASWPRRA